MSYPESDDYTNTQGSTGFGDESFDSSTQRGRNTDREQLDEFGSAQRRDTSGQYGSSDQSQQYGREASGDFGSGGFGQQGRDTGYEQQGRDVGYEQQDRDTGYGRQGSDTSGFAQTRREAGDEGYGQSGGFGQSETARKPGMMEKPKGQTERSGRSEDTGAYGESETRGPTQHEPSLMEKIKSEAQKMTGKKGHASDTTEQEYGGDEYSGGEHQSGEYGQSDSGAAKPSMMDKIKGGAEKLSGKMSKDPERVQAGQARQEGRYEGSTGGY